MFASQGKFGFRMNSCVFNGNARWPPDSTIRCHFWEEKKIFFFLSDSSCFNGCNMLLGHQKEEKHAWARLKNFHHFLWEKCIGHPPQRDGGLKPENSDHLVSLKVLHVHVSYYSWLFSYLTQFFSAISHRHLSCFSDGIEKTEYLTSKCRKQNHDFRLDFCRLMKISRSWVNSW